MSVASGSSQSGATSRKRKKKKKKRVDTSHKMLHFLSRYDGYSEYMQELIGEHSSENLLFLTEAMQWRDYRTGKLRSGSPKLILSPSSSSQMSTPVGSSLKKQESSPLEVVKESQNLRKSDNPLLDKLKLPFAHIPSSAALNPSLDALSQGKVIYDKYVKEYSELEINISFSQRKQLKNVFSSARGRSNAHLENRVGDLVNEVGNEDNNASPYVFDAALTEVWKLLSSAFRRYDRLGRINTDMDEENPEE